MRDKDPMATRKIAAVAERVAWRKSAEELLSDPIQFLAHVMTFGDVEDVVTAEMYFTGSDFHRVLEHTPAGIFDP